MNADQDAPGIHGKLPSHGDFITRRLPREFVDGWDEWLQRSIAASKTELGEQWLDIYLTSPIWSFVLEAGICGANGWAGVLMPSVDRVGRYFPLTIAVSLPSSYTPCAIAVGDGDWFERARSLALSSLEQDDFSLESFDTSVAGLGRPRGIAADGFMPDEARGTRGLYLPIPSPGGPLAALIRLAHGFIERELGRYSVWWSEGSELVPGCLLLGRSLPPPVAWTAFLDGRFRAEHWLATQSIPNDSAKAAGST